jgi:hypothetical protein
LVTCNHDDYRRLRVYEVEFLTCAYCISETFLLKSKAILKNNLKNIAAKTHESRVSEISSFDVNKVCKGSILCTELNCLVSYDVTLNCQSKNMMITLR